jgi:hypothetical protein
VELPGVFARIVSRIAVVVPLNNLMVRVSLGVDAPPPL